MHELSIATVLLELVNEHTPEGATVKKVHVRAGPLRAIEPDAMELAWTAATDSTPCAASTLELEVIPWDLHCPDCDRRWQSDDPYEPCTCGCAYCRPSGNNDLLLMSIDVDEP